MCSCVLSLGTSMLSAVAPTSNVDQCVWQTSEQISGHHIRTQHVLGSASVAAAASTLAGGQPCAGQIGTQGCCLVMQVLYTSRLPPGASSQATQPLFPLQHCICWFQPLLSMNHSGLPAFTHQCTHSVLCRWLPSGFWLFSDLFVLPLITCAMLSPTFVHCFPLQVAAGCARMEEAVLLLNDGGAPPLAPALQQDIQESLHDLKPQCVLDHLKV